MSPIVNCYWGTWTYFRAGDGKFTPSNIDASKVTHITLAFFKIDAQGAIKWDQYLPREKILEELFALRGKNRNIKFIAAVGGWEQEGTSRFPGIARSAARRKEFAQSALEFLRHNDFDGLDVDWEYPKDSEKHNFTYLLEELYEVLRPNGLELSIAVGATAARASESYDIPEICKYVDHINLMTYDLSGAADGVIGFNAPLYGHGSNTVDACVRYWKNYAPARKLLLGLAFYGRTFRVPVGSSSEPGSPCVGPGVAGPHTQEAGMLAYYEIRQLETRNEHYDEDAESCYLYHEQTERWISYDNPRTIHAKTKYALQNNLGGVMVWAIDMDEFRGRNYPNSNLLAAISDAIHN